MSKDWLLVGLACLPILYIIARLLGPGVSEKFFRAIGRSDIYEKWKKQMNEDLAGVDDKLRESIERERKINRRKSNPDISWHNKREDE